MSCSPRHPPARRCALRRPAPRHPDRAAAERRRGAAGDPRRGARARLRGEPGGDGGRSLRRLGAGGQRRGRDHRGPDHVHPRLADHAGAPAGDRRRPARARARRCRISSAGSRRSTRGARSRPCGSPSSGTFVVGNPPPSFGGRYFVFLQLDDRRRDRRRRRGLRGDVPPARRRADDRRRLRAADLGMDPFRIETMWRRMYASGYTARPDVSLVGVMSGIEMACWDIVGKAVEQARLRAARGRVHERLRGYTYLYVEDGDPRRRLPRSGAAAERAAGVRGPRASPRSSSILPAPTRRSTRGSPTSRRSSARRQYVRASARRSAHAATCSSERTGSSPPPGRSGWPAGSSSSTRSGSRSPSLPTSPRRWPGRAGDHDPDRHG